MPNIPQRLTELEGLLMNVVWDVGEVTVRDVHRRIRPVRDLAYTTVLTMMGVMERKGLVTHDKRGRANVYRARLSRQAFGAQSARQIVDSYFQGMVKNLVMHFADHGELGEEDIAALERVIEAAKSRPAGDRVAVPVDLDVRE
ncbi:MAG: BlaI/MecI/CopY family transcriptional regulator [Phycisphaerales bacterium]|nr:BlaI/MecI/CopY family transcriptional regulator [Phycisphaerales bacterium]